MDFAACESMKTGDGVRLERNSLNLSSFENLRQANRSFILVDLELRDA